MKEGWTLLKIKDVCSKASSNIMQNKIAGLTGDYPVFGASGYVQNVDFYHRDKPYIGIVKDGSGVGRVNTYPAYSSLLGTLQYIVPREGYSLKYVAYALKSLNLSKFSSGAAIPHIYFRDYGECEILVPPFPDQDHIVTELDLLSDIIEKKKAQLKELDNLTKSIFYDMFGDPISNENGWETKSLKNVCIRLYAGGDVPKNDLSAERTPIFNTPIFSNSIENDGLYGYTSTPRECDKCITLAGRGVNVGYPIMRTTPFFPIIRLVVAVPNTSIVIAELLLFITRIMNLQGNGGAIPQLTIPMIRDKQIILPPITLQNEFASKIKAIEQQKTAIKKSIDEAQALFDSRMDYYFN